MLAACIQQEVEGKEITRLALSDPLRLFANITQAANAFYRVGPPWSASHLFQSPLSHVLSHGLECL